MSKILKRVMLKLKSTDLYLWMQHAATEQEVFVYNKSNRYTGLLAPMTHLYRFCWPFQRSLKQTVYEENNTKSYLNNRQQSVLSGSKLSKWRTIISGVPQEFILGPLLFVFYTYINDLII